MGCYRSQPTAWTRLRHTTPSFTSSETSTRKSTGSSPACSDRADRVDDLPSGQFETVRRGWMGGSMFFSAPGRRATLDQLADAGFTETETVTATDPLGSDSEFVFATLADACNSLLP